jgi:hypothetical protein
MYTEQEILLKMFFRATFFRSWQLGGRKEKVAGT